MAIKPAVYGIIAFPIPTPEGELNWFARKYAHVLGDAGGRVLLWRPIGDPRRTDKAYQDQRTSAMKRADDAGAAEYDKSVARSGSTAHYIRGEILKACKKYGVTQQELPLVLFLAGDPVNEKAVLHIDRSVFIAESSRINLSVLLAEELSEQMMLGFAVGGAFSAASMHKIQRHLTALERNIVRLIRSPQSSATSSAGRDVSRQAPAIQRRAADIYAIAYSGDKRERTLTKVEYEKLIGDRGQYDFIIDGISRKCFKRSSRAELHQEAQLTVAEFALIREYIVCGGIHRPIEFRSESSGDALTAIRLFNSTRHKVDIDTHRYHFTLFHTHKGGTTDWRRYEFAPDKNISWLLIEMAGQ